jgi:sec-independent protein translocase protein TatC
MPEAASAPPPGTQSREDLLRQMSFLEHLEELRKRLIYSLVSVAVSFFICYNYREQLYGFMQRPIIEALRSHQMSESLVYLSPTEPFNLYIKIGFLAGVFFACPVILYQLWLFISPGLYRHEKRYVVPFMISTVGLFIAGGLFGYKIAFPAALDFLIGYSKQFTPMITIGEYTDLFLTIIIGLGAIFELPILAFFLGLMGIISPMWLWNNFRYSILIIFVIAAIVTPTTDILNMCIFAAPMILLYLVSILVVWIVYPKRRNRGKEAT